MSLFRAATILLVAVLLLMAMVLFVTVEPKAMKAFV